MARARTSRFQRTSAPLKAKIWTAGPRQITVPTVTAAGATLWAVGSQASVDLTQLRLRGSFQCWLETVTTIGDGFLRNAIGMCVVNENAFGVGIMAISHPLTDAGWDGWLYHRYIGAMVGFSVTEGENTGTVSQVRFEIDSKAMRKIKPTDVFVGVFEAGAEVGAATLQFIAETRTLDLIR